MMRWKDRPSKSLSPGLNILTEVIDIVNYIKTRPLKSRIFAALCEDVGPYLCCFVLHADGCHAIRCSSASTN